MPDRYDPDRRLVNAVEEAIRIDDDLAMGELRKLRNLSPRVGKRAQTPEDSLRLLPEPYRRERVVLAYVLDGTGARSVREERSGERARRLFASCCPMRPAATCPGFLLAARQGDAA
jgi:hypothetical protein